MNGSPSVSVRILPNQIHWGDFMFKRISSRIAATVFVLVLASSSALAQSSLTFGPSPWTWNGSVEATVSQVSYRNWAAGGDYSYMLGLNSSIDPQWSDSLWSFVGSWYGEFAVYKRKSQPFQKTNDELELDMKGGRRLVSFVHAVLFVDLQSQFWPGYTDYTGPWILQSAFMSPGYLNNGAGIDFRFDSLGLSVVLSAISSKQTFVLDNRIDPTQYGVDAGKRVHSEFGAYARITYAANIISNFSVNSRAILFQNYQKRFGPDLALTAELDYAITSIVKLYARVKMLNDDDIRISIYQNLSGNQNTFAGVGPRLQIATDLGVALNLNF